MPRGADLPTPASSTDIPGRDGTKQLASLQMAFELPPPAMTPSEGPRPPPIDNKLSPPSPEPQYQTSPSAPFPLQAAETVKSRRRSSAARGQARDAFALPPPPTRSRKIIQMKPRTHDEARTESSNPAPKGSAGGKTAAGSGGPAAAAAASSTSTTSKKKQPSATSAAGRKIARKTAHSLIERRRRSKMNEEFAVLKNMIPACEGEMHKLAILQASIEYVRYLEDCVAKLKAQRDEPSPTTPTEAGPPTTSGGRGYMPEESYLGYQGTQSPDVEMTGSELASPTSAANAARSSQTSISPALLAEDSRGRNDSYSSVSTDPRHYSFAASSNTSPAFGPRAYNYPRGSASASGSTLTSPALVPQRDLDQEATAALLMLNSDRRSAVGGSNGRGMSVRDLLSA